MQDHRPHRWLAIATLAAASLAIVAVAAGQASNPPAAQSSGASVSGAAPEASAAASANADSSTTPTPPASRADGVVHVTNGPVPDTPDTRARYGAPMSNAGQTTAPAGD